MTSIPRGTRSRLVERIVYVLSHSTATPLTGTVTTDGTTAVVGSGTTFTADYEAGDSIYIEGEEPNTVASVTDATHLVLTTAAGTTASGLEHARDPGLFEYFGGKILAGSIDSPDVAPRIEAWPVESLGETLRDTPSCIVQPVRPSGVFDALPSGVNRPVYEVMVTLFIRTDPQRLVAGELNTDDVYLQIRNVLCAGENPGVPGKLLDPDDLIADGGEGRALNIHIGGYNEETPRRYKDVTLYPLRLAYVCEENIRTGALS